MPSTNKEQTFKKQLTERRHEVCPTPDVQGHDGEDAGPAAVPAARTRKVAKLRLENLTGKEGRTSGPARTLQLPLQVSDSSVLTYTADERCRSQMSYRGTPQVIKNYTLTSKHTDTHTGT